MAPANEEAIPSINEFRIEKVDELTGPRKEIKIPIPGFLKSTVHKMVKDPKDNRMAEFVVNHMLINLIPMICFFTIPAIEKWSFVYLILHILTLQPTILFIHYVSHVRPWAKGMEFLRYYAIVIQLGFIGISPFGYESHHLRMHHGENNAYDGYFGDLSSTEIYERDNFFHWIIYWLRFYLGICLELPIWAFSKGQYFECFRDFSWIIAYYGSYYYLYTIKPTPAFWCLLLPHVIGGVALMLGNFSQHVFVKPDKCRSSYGLAYNIINSHENQNTWNDCYHLQHHLNSQIRWHDLPSSFIRMQDKIARNGGLTFKNCEFLNLGLWSFLGKTDKIHEHFVPLCKEQLMTKEEFRVFIDEWYRPIHPAKGKHWLLMKFLAATAKREPYIVKNEKRA